MSSILVGPWAISWFVRALNITCSSWSRRVFCLISTAYYALTCSIRFWYLLAWKSLLAAYFPLRKVRWFPVWGAWQRYRALFGGRTNMGWEWFYKYYCERPSSSQNLYLLQSPIHWLVLWIHLWASLFWPTLSGNHTVVEGWLFEYISLNLPIPPPIVWQPLPLVFKDGSPHIYEPSHSPLQSGIHLWLKDDSMNTSL